MLAMEISEKPLKWLQDLKPQQTPQKRIFRGSLVKMMQKNQSLQINEKHVKIIRKLPT